MMGSSCKETDESRELKILQNFRDSPVSLPQWSWNEIWGLDNPVNQWAESCIILPSEQADAGLHVQSD